MITFPPHWPWPNLPQVGKFELFLFVTSFTSRELLRSHSDHPACGIFTDANTGLISLWDVTDLPERAKSEKGSGQKVIATCGWKNELPAMYPGLWKDSTRTRRFDEHGLLAKRTLREISSTG
jgi:hypothetical protein